MQQPTQGIDDISIEAMMTCIILCTRSVARKEREKDHLINNVTQDTTTSTRLGMS
jgi:chaperonin GroEL (HSP60 family)